MDREEEVGDIVKEKYERIYQKPRHRKQIELNIYNTFLAEPGGTIGNLWSFPSNKAIATTIIFIVLYQLLPLLLLLVV